MSTLPPRYMIIIPARRCIAFGRCVESVIIGFYDMPKNAALLSSNILMRDFAAVFSFFCLRHLHLVCPRSCESTYIQARCALSCRKRYCRQQRRRDARRAAVERSSASILRLMMLSRSPLHHAYDLILRRHFCRCLTLFLRRKIFCHDMMTIFVACCHFSAIDMPH